MQPPLENYILLTVPIQHAHQERERILAPQLAPKDIDQTPTVLLHLPQWESFPGVCKTLRAGKAINEPKYLSMHNQVLNKDRLIRVGEGLQAD